MPGHTIELKMLPWLQARIHCNATNEDLNSAKKISLFKVTVKPVITANSRTTPCALELQEVEFKV